MLSNIFRSRLARIGSACLFWLLFGSLALNSQAIDRYCSSRFNICLEYPSPPFSDPERTANDDGISLENDALGLNLQASASYNVMNWSLKDVQKLEEEEMAEVYGKVDFRVNRPQKNVLELRFSAEGLPHYFQVMQRGDVLIFLRLRADRPMAETTFEDILSRIRLVPEI